MTTQDKLTFFAIVGGTILLVFILFGLEISGIYTLPTRQTTEVTIIVAAPPALTPWLEQAAQTFNQSQANQTVRIAELPDLSPAPESPPDVWIADATFIRQHLGNLPFETGGDSVAHNSLVWVVVPQRLAEAETEAAMLDWQAVQQIVTDDLQFRLALPPPGTVARLASCLSAAASYHQQANLTVRLAREGALHDWFSSLQAAISNPNHKPLDQLRRRPPEAAVGVMLQQDSAELAPLPFEQHPPTYNVALDYPYLTRTGLAEPALAAATRFESFLLAAAQQSALLDYGLSAVDAPPMAEQWVSVEALTVRELAWCWQ